MIRWMDGWMWWMVLYQSVVDGWMNEKEGSIVDVGWQR